MANHRRSSRQGTAWPPWPGVVDGAVMDVASKCRAQHGVCASVGAGQKSRDRRRQSQGRVGSERVAESVRCSVDGCPYLYPGRRSRPLQPGQKAHRRRRTGKQMKAPLEKKTPARRLDAIFGADAPFPPSLSCQGLTVCCPNPGGVLGYPGGGAARRIPPGAKLATAPCRSSTIVQDANRATPTHLLAWIAHGPRGAIGAE